MAGQKEGLMRKSPVIGLCLLFALVASATETTQDAKEMTVEGCCWNVATATFTLKDNKSASVTLRCPLNPNDGDGRIKFDDESQTFATEINQAGCTTVSKGSTFAVNINEPISLSLPSGRIVTIYYFHWKAIQTRDGFKVVQPWAARIAY